MSMLEQYKWKNRLLLIFAPDKTNADYRKMQAYLDSNEEGIQQRELKIIQYMDDVVGLNSPLATQVMLRQQFGIPQQGFYMLLIGKDGTIKERYDQPTMIEHIFDLIDSMPMRQQEMDADSGE